MLCRFYYTVFVPVSHNKNFTPIVQTFSFKLLSQFMLFSAMWLFLFYCPSSATFSTQPMKPLACMLQPCRLRTLLLQQILYRSAAFHFNSLLRCSILLQHVLVNSLKLLEVQDALKFLQPIKNVLLQKVEHQISGLHHFPCRYSCKLTDDGSCQKLLCQWCAGGHAVVKPHIYRGCIIT